MDKQVDNFERILKFAENYGISFISLVAFLCMMLYVAIVTIRLLQKWVPAWFMWSIKSHQKTIRFLDKATETLTCIHEKNHALVDGCHHLAEAALSHAMKNQKKLEIGQDILLHLGNAATLLGASRRHDTSPEQEYESDPPEDPSPLDVELEDLDA